MQGERSAHAASVASTTSLASARSSEAGQAVDHLFSGPASLRVRGEQRALWMCALAAPVTLALIGLFLETVTFSGFVLLIVAGLVFVSVGRGRLLGSSVRIDDRQMPEIHALVGTLAQRLGVPQPQVFVRDDPFQAITALGTGEPYSLVLSSQYVEHLRREELAFLIARELAHIGAGHTRIASLLSVSGRENPVVALVFGAWLRRSEFTADRVGLLCCDGVDAALGAISIATFHAIGRRIDMQALAEQRRELEAEPTLRMGEWIAAIPYATNRLDALRAFDTSPLATHWRATLSAPAQRPTVPADSAVPAPAGAPPEVRYHDCAGFWARSTALGVDLVVVAAILKFHGVAKLTNNAQSASSHEPPPILWAMQHLPLVAAGAGVVAVLVVYFLYSAVLVGLAGQTLGMMIFELRVVTTRFGRPSLVQCIWRYAVAFASAVTTAAVLGCFSRVHPHDRFSRTRVVRARRSLA